jgi:hypothetical protein
MSSFSRRQLLIFFGASAGAAVLTPALGEKRLAATLVLPKKHQKRLHL